LGGRKWVQWWSRAGLGASQAGLKGANDLAVGFVVHTRNIEAQRVKPDSFWTCGMPEEVAEKVAVDKKAHLRR
jgi:hypothetical protein